MRKILHFRLLALPLSLLVLALFSALSVKTVYAALIPEPLPHINTSFANIDTINMQAVNQPVLLNGTHYFVLDTEPYGAEIWRTDGTAAGTSLVRDLYPGRIDGVHKFLPGVYNVADLVVAGDALYFLGNDGTGNFIWRYDSSGFQKTDFNVSRASHLSALVAVGDALYAAAEVDSKNELWRIVGTTATKIDLNPNGSFPEGLAAVGDALYVSAILENIGRRLLYIEGTTPTVIDFGEDTPFLRVMGILEAGDMAYVTTVYKEGLGKDYDIWQIIGTTPTRIEVNTPASSFPSPVAVVNDSFYFLEQTDADGINRLWRYDGTTTTPIEIKDDKVSVKYLTRVHDALYFLVPGFENNKETIELWRLEGMAAAKVAMTVIYNIYPGAHKFAVVGDTLYIAFPAMDTADLWKVEGITSTKIQPYPMGIIHDLTAVGNRLWVLASMVPTNDPSYGPTETSYSEYDGERFNALNGPFGTSSKPSEYVEVGGDLYFSAFDGTDVELWHLHKNSMVKIDINAGDSSSYPSGLTAVGDAIYLQVTDGTDTSLWQVIGNTAVKIDLHTGEIGPLEFVAVDGAIYAATFNSTTPSELYRVDGVNVTKINIEGATRPFQLTAVGTTLYLVVTTNSSHELWQVKGTSATRIDSQWSLWALTAQGDTLYLAATNNEAMTELWQVKGTTITRLPIPATFLSVPQVVVANSTIYLADSGFCTAFDEAIPGTIWRVKGEDVAQVDFEALYCPNHLTAVGDALYLSGRVNGDVELWQVTDTHASKIDINPGEGWSDPQDLTVMGNTLYLSAFDGTDRELWRVRGLNRFEADIFAGQGSGEVTNIFATSSKLYFSAWGSTSSGAELWTVTEVDSLVFLPGVRK